MQGYHERKEEVPQRVNKEWEKLESVNQRNKKNITTLEYQNTKRKTNGTVKNAWSRDKEQIED